MKSKKEHNHLYEDEKFSVEAFCKRHPNLRYHKKRIIKTASIEERVLCFRLMPLSR